MRTSQYVIFVRVPERDEYYIIHSFTGAVDKVSPEVVKFLLDSRDPARVHRRTKDEALALESLRGRVLGEASADAKKRLYERGYLTEKTLEEETRYAETLARWIHRRNVENSFPSFMLVPMYECNLRCPYCFEKDTRIILAKKSKAALQKVMSEAQIDDVYRCIDIISETRHGGRCPNHIRLYGGEPMADMTLGAVEYLVDKGRRRGFNFSAITNAVDLHLFLHLLGPDLIQGLQITLDGPRHIHDRKRIGPLHKKTYDRILANLKRVQDAKKDVVITLRVHADKENIDVLANLVEDLERAGLNEAPNVQIVTETTTNFGAFDDDYNSTFPEPTLRHNEAHQHLSEKDPSLLPVLNINDQGVTTVLISYLREKLPGIMARVEPCSATKGQYVFDPNGQIYTCWDDVGIRGKEIGFYTSEGPVFNDLAEQWRQRSPAEIEDCRACKYAFFHFSGCAAIPMHQRNTVFARACYDYEESFLYFSHRLFREQGHLQVTRDLRAEAAATAAAH